MGNEIEKQNNEILTDALAWLKDILKENKFFDASLGFTCHDGKLTKITKSITEKLI